MPESPLSPQALYAARPTVRVNDAAQDRITGLLQALDMVEREDGLSTLELKCGNWCSLPTGSAGFAFEDEAALKLGDVLTVYAGDAAAPQEIFRGKVTALEADFPEDGPPTLTALAEDALQAARCARRTRTYENQTLADIAREIAGNLGLTPQITALTQQCGTQVQYNESDLAFLRRLLVRYDADVQVVGTELHVSPRGQVRRGSITLQRGGQLRRASVLADLAHQVNEITVAGWDAKAGQRIRTSSTGAQAGPGAGRTGASLLETAIVRRSHHLSHLQLLDAAEATAVADAACDERARRFVTLEGTAEGNPALRVGTHVSIDGLGPRFSNTYYVVRCRHRYDLERGYETDFTAECGFLGSP